MTRSPAGPRHWFDRCGIWLLALGSLAPLVWLNRDLRALFWFGDDWDLLDQMQSHGFWTWTVEVFAENFVPLFKLLWGAMVWVGGGHYFWMVCCLWFTHAVNCLLLARLLRRVGFGVEATILAVVLFGLSATNLESLGWAVQWSSLLSSAFFLAAALSYFRAEGDGGASGSKATVAPALWAAASALSFSRGVITGAALAAISLWPRSDDRLPWSRRGMLAALFLLPAVAVAGVIFFAARGNHRDLLGHFGEAVTFGSWNYGLNPIHRLIGVDSLGWRTAIILTLAKAGLAVWAIRRSPPAMRRLLLLLVLVDLGNSVLLGIGRFHTGLAAVLSSRYQYSALISTAPFLALGLDALRQRAALRWRVAATAFATAVLVAACALLVARAWPAEAASWASYRGRATRELLFVNPNPPAEGAIPGIEFLKTQRAKELVERYQLR